MVNAAMDMGIVRRSIAIALFCAAVDGMAMTRPAVAQTPDGQGGPPAGFGAAAARGAQPQVQQQYDLRGYTGYVTQMATPEQAIIQWILRETGTDVWFGAPYGYLWANRDALQVYHTPEVQAVVRKIVDRFVAGPKEPQVFTVGIVKVGNPNWRTEAMHLLQPVEAQSPGVQAWLISKENAAVLQQQLQRRADYKTLQLQDLVLYNGQTQKLAASRTRNYIRGARQNAAGWPEPDMAEIKEGYEVEISPLLETDGATMDLVLRCQIDQVERLVPVDVNMMLASGQVQSQRIEVPQLVSYRMQERFRWRSDQILLLSVGVVATPDASASPMDWLNLDWLGGGTPGRADALLWVHYKGRGTPQQLPSTPAVATTGNDISRGRY